MELAETYVILGIIAIGTTKKHIDNLVRALTAISKKYYNPKHVYPEHEFDVTFPFMLIRPRTAYQAPTLKINIDEAEYCVCKEMIMIYPPGIPLIVPGEIITKDIVKKIKEYRASKDITILSEHNDGCVSVIDTEKWKRYEVYRSKIERYAKKRVTAPRNDGFYLDNRALGNSSFFFGWPTQICKNKRINDSFKRDLNSILSTLLKYNHVDIAISKSNQRDVDHLSNNSLSISSLKPPMFNSMHFTPLVLQNANKRIRFVSFNSTYSLGDNSHISDMRVLKKMYDFGKYDVYVTDSYLPERSSFIIDGNKTALLLDEPLTVEDSFIRLSTREIEENVKIYFNVERVLWIPNIPLELKNRGYHLSDVLNFVNEETICVSYPGSKGVFSKYIDSLIIQLKKYGYQVIKLPMVRNIFPNRMECKAFGLDPNISILRTYTPFLRGDDYFIFSTSGNAKFDEEVKKKFLKYYPDAKIEFIDTYYLSLVKSNLREFITCVPAYAPEK